MILQNFNDDKRCNKIVQFDISVVNIMCGMWCDVITINAFGHDIAIFTHKIWYATTTWGKR